MAPARPHPMDQTTTHHARPTPAPRCEATQVLPVFHVRGLVPRLALVVSHAQQQDRQERLDRREHRSGCAVDPTIPSTSTSAPMTATTTATRSTAGLTRVPELRLPVPPRPLRPLTLMSSGVDVVDEMGRMLSNQPRRPLILVRDNAPGHTAEPRRRGNDVLDDIYHMITSAPPRSGGLPSPHRR
ncbi:uncharacterized protein BXZ73DRAFT_101768 [Epithele typhae]|uniref:uncharacterized protein n=1 Tax=Epithele typhae TaxID=378194 RepID=UPI002008170E|nr:uncharacterized protein BXZ73DRAFT_101768 [Epithele typhae]KAH9931187.1 hypothetical protein BXZ73DRAFT_101768 [Epithele typhae]